MTDMTFSGESFFQTDQPFRLQNAVLSESFLKNVDMRNAKLEGADMSKTRLYAVNLAGADCVNAVFTQSVWNDVKISEVSCFKQAVFQDVDFNQLTFSGKQCAGSSQYLNMSNASFVHANLLGCKLTDVDLSYSSFRNALLSGAQFIRTKISYGDFFGAIMTNLRMTNDGQLQRMDARYANLDQCTLANAFVQGVDWSGSRIANSNFTFAHVENCSFDSCYGQNLTFRDAQLESCQFQYAMLSSADFTYAEVNGCNFSDGNLQNGLFIFKPDGKGTGNICNSIFHRTSFSESLFQGCIFYQCDFTDADFTNTKLVNVQFVECIFSAFTKFDDAIYSNVKWLSEKDWGGQQ